MFRRNIYYSLKPLIPLRVRRAVRGHFVRRKLKRVGDIWPILESAGTRPEVWPGWPEGRQFAFVLTHDVEGAEGLAKVRQLAELEMSLGFRSSFNFVPEGEYSVPADLRAWLTDNGFEVGVHDLHHDGKLYKSREQFRSRAERINRHIKDWGAVGYRSGFMLHNYDWHHDLQIRYDATAFDTDPFEPQPDGVGTIFPFFVPKEETLADGPTVRQSDGRSAPRAGYVELPYTLPQDSTLFFLLQETTDQIWRQKLGWVAQKGGMALLNTHPDYMHFGNGPSDARHFSAEIYAGFLRHVAGQFHGQYWNAVPAAVATHAQAHAPTRISREPRRICMVTYSNYETDNRVRRYAETLARRGDQVEVFAVKPGAHSPPEIILHGVRVSRIVPKAQLRNSTLAYMLQVSRFFLKTFVVLTARALRTRYDLIHVHNMPDFLVFAALIPRLRGAKIILDLHDLVPELFVDKSTGLKSRIMGALLRWEEKISALAADHVIISNHLWVKEVTERSARPEKCSVFINNVDADVFYPRSRTRKDDRKIILFHGTLSRHQGVDLVVEAMPHIRKSIPNAELHLYGTGSEVEHIRSMMGEPAMKDAVFLHPPVTLSEIPEIVANADVGVVAKRADSFGNRAYSTKILEFMSQGVPVVLSRTEIDQFYFDDTVARFFDSGDVSGLARAVIDVLTDEARRSRQVENALRYATANAWESRRRVYLSIVDGLIENRLKPVGLERPSLVVS